MLIVVAALAGSHDVCGRGPCGFFAAFVVTVLVTQAAILIRD